ncbi:MAG: apolipoprotein N-acyltransferase [Alphaproteobacteria bacterium]
MTAASLPASVLEPFLVRLAARVANLSRWRRRALAFALGMLVAAAMPPVAALPLLWPAFVGLVWLLDGAGRGRAAFGTGFWFGWGMFVAGIYWVAISMTVDLARFGWMIPFAVFGLSGVMALLTGLATWAAWRLRPRGAGRIFALAVFWAGSEWLRAQTALAFPWNPLALIWTALDAPLQIAAVVGTYGTGLLTVLVAALPALLGIAELRRAGRLQWTAAAVILLAALWAFGAWRLSGAPDASVPGVRLRLVQPNISQVYKWDEAQRAEHLQTYLTLSGQDANRPITHIIWPETAVFYFLALEPEIRARIGAVVPQNGLIVTGSLRTERQPGRARDYWNSLHAIAPDGTIVATYDKHHLVPFGEYVPARSVLGVLGIEKLTQGRQDFSRGPGPRTLKTASLPPFSPLICYETIFPDQAVDPADRPEFLLNVTNDAWFGNSSGPYQHFALARLRAVEQGLPMVRAANTGISGVVDAYGRVTARLGLDRKGIVDADLPRALARPTVYARWGDLGALALGIFGLVAALVFGRRARSRPVQ